MAGSESSQREFLKKLPLALRLLRAQVKDWKRPVVGTFAEGPNAPYKVLISTVLSLRTKDLTTEAASRRLFALAETPAEMLGVSEEKIRTAIYPVGFYRTKAKNVLAISRILVERFGGRVPDDLDTLLELPGVGRKTANLVVTVGYGKSGICVDTHVHRISNRWGFVKTRTPDETETVLREILPPQYWIGYNDLLVAFGQNLCTPISPFCSRCKLTPFCPKIGVGTRR